MKKNGCEKEEVKNHGLKCPSCTRNVTKSLIYHLESKEKKEVKNG